jgi:hypothetical protein
MDFFAVRTKINKKLNHHFFSYAWALKRYQFFFYKILHKENIRPIKAKFTLNENFFDKVLGE